jgi:hypothetical protein
MSELLFTTRRYVAFHIVVQFIYWILFQFNIQQLIAMIFAEKLQIKNVITKRNVDNFLI